MGHINCDNCGRLFEQSLQKQIRNKHNYCSKKCYHEHRDYSHPGNSTLKDVPCSWCGATLRRPKWDRERRKHFFCNPHHYGKWHSVNDSGENSPGWRGGYKYHYGGAAWKATRRKARKRDGHACQGCGVTEQAWGNELDVHHIVPRHLFKSPREADKLVNLKTLCRTCHSGKHALIKRVLYG